MLVDWVTVVAQILNFLILAAVLKFLLYDRIVQALDERQGRLEGQLDDASRRKEEAERNAREYREKKEQIERKRDGMLQEAREQAQKRRKELESDARQDVDQRRDRWLEALQSRQESFLQDLRMQAGGQLCDIASRALRDLADRDLQHQVVRVFVAKLDNLSGDAMQPQGEDDSPVVVRSAWDLEDDAREQIEGKIRDRFDTGQSDIRFQTDEQVICGVEIRRSGRSIGWTVEAYLDQVTEAIRTSIEQQAGREERQSASAKETREGEQEDGNDQEQDTGQAQEEDE
jgi:F-type H+-transporting ATPase subunit b